MDAETIKAFADLLEEHGYATLGIKMEGKSDALRLVEGLVSVARRKHISLSTAAREYADQDEEQDTSWHQLFGALQEIPEEKIAELDIYDPL